MTYRLLILGAFVGSATAAHADTRRVALVVEGAGDQKAEVELAVSKVLLTKFLLVEEELLKKNLHPVGGALDDDAIAKLRKDVGAVRVVMIEIKRQGKDRFSLTVRAADENGIPWRFGDATTPTLADEAARLVSDLPPVSEPPPAKVAPPPPTVPERAETPPVAGHLEAAHEDSAVGSGRHAMYRRKHPIGLLIGGTVAFLLPYFATVGLASHYEGYNSNAAHQGYIPIAGPFLARQRLNDKDLKDGYDIGLLLDGIVQVLTFNAMLAGIVYCAVGEKRYETDRHAHVSWRPLVSFGSQEARVGAWVQW